MSGLYIHVPFCQKRCHYCSFYSTTYGKRERELYVKALLNEIDDRADEFEEPTNENKEHIVQTKRQTNKDRYKLTSVYFGGGTPSQLDQEELYQIFLTLRSHFNIDDAEITFECNPDDIGPKYATTLAGLGVNRISMGVQSFDDAILQSINRRHTAAQVHNAIHTFHKVGIHNISIDLIYGLPGQTLDNWKHDLDTAIDLARPQEEFDKRPAITHISSYALSIEEGTHLYNMRARGELREVDEATFLRMYDMLVDKLTKAGFEHYEISNFALSGFSSHHNSSYWTGVPYLGLGPGAHSYNGTDVRRWNTADLRTYISAPSAPHEEERLSSKDQYNEKIITRLRTKEGLSISALTTYERHHLEQQAQRYLVQGLLQTDGNRIALTHKGIFVSDSIFADLMMEV